MAEDRQDYPDNLRYLHARVMPAQNFADVVIADDNVPDHVRLLITMAGNFPLRLLKQKGTLFADNPEAK